MTKKEKLSEQTPSGSTFLLPKEEMLEIRRKGKKIRIGIPSDKGKVEYRVPLTPQAVELLVSYGHEILIEKEAGKAFYEQREPEFSILLNELKGQIPNQSQSK